MTTALDIAALAGFGLTLVVATVPAIGTYFVMKYRVDRLEQDVRDLKNDHEALSEKHFQQIYQTLTELSTSVARIEGRLNGKD